MYYNYGEYPVSEHVCGAGRLIGFEEGCSEWEGGSVKKKEMNNIKIICIHK